MGIRELIKRDPEHFPEYAEKVLDGYFGNIFVTYKNKEILYVNKRMAESVHMTKDELTALSLEELREKKIWLRSMSQELYETGTSFDGYNVSKSGDELFTHVEAIKNDKGEVVMGVHYSIPRKMLMQFSDYIDAEKADLQKYKNISEFQEAQKEAQDVIICESPATRMVFQDALLLSPLDNTILICGETGAGKDVLANFIHKHSPRAKKSFVPVNCSAIPADLMEAEFFGYERGAFTGASSSGKMGLFEMADNGTLFLDEIGELSMAMQSKFLRTLENGDIMRLGGTKTIHTNTRIIAATNRDLKTMVKDKQFREDLYYRLNVMPLYLPPLRERQEDILPLANLFLERYNRKYHQNKSLTPEMNQELLLYEWPGNIRELRNVIERYAIAGRLDIYPSSMTIRTASADSTLSGGIGAGADGSFFSTGNSRIGNSSGSANARSGAGDSGIETEVGAGSAYPDDAGIRTGDGISRSTTFGALPEAIRPAASGASPIPAAGVSLPPLPLHEACADFERQYILQALHTCGGSMAKAAKQLGIHRSLLYRKCDLYQIDYQKLRK